MQPHSGCVLKVGVTAPAKEPPPFKFPGSAPVKVITCNDIHLSINPLYLNVAVLFISECLATLFYTGKSISVINSKFFWLDMSVCNSWIAMKTFLTLF